MEGSSLDKQVLMGLGEKFIMLLRLVGEVSCLPLSWRQFLLERTHKAESCHISHGLSRCLTFGLFLNVLHF